MTPGDAQLHAMLTRLQLTSIRDRLDGLLEDAARRELDLRETLALLCSAEVEYRDQRRVAMGTSIAKFPFVRTLDDYDYEAQPSIDPRQVRDLATCRWVANGDCVLLLGPPGVGKTHLAVGLGRAAIARGYSTLFVSAAALVASLSQAQHDGSLDDRVTFYAKPKLLVIDELGYLPLDKHAAHLFFQLVARRYERDAVLLTSNRSVGEGGTSSATPSSPRRSSTASSTTATSSPSAASQAASARGGARACSVQPAQPEGDQTFMSPGDQVLLSLDTAMVDRARWPSQHPAQGRCQ